MFKGSKLSVIRQEYTTLVVTPGVPSH